METSRWLRTLAPYSSTQLKMSDRFPVLLATSITCFGLALGCNSSPSFALGAPPVLAQAQDDGTPSEFETLEPGSEGKEVRVLQHFLKELGYFEDALDGEYGAGTEAAISQFQESQDLEVNGITDAKTWEQIKAVHAEQVKADGGGGGAEAREKKPGRKPKLNRQRIILILGGLLTLGIAGAGLVFLLQAFNKAMPQPPLDFDEDEADGEKEAIAASNLDELPGELPLLPLQKKGDRKKAPAKNKKESSTPQKKSTQQEKYPVKTAVKTSKPKTQSNNSKSLAVKSPHRLPKIDLVEELIKDLQEPQPEKRRKAIWELAQKADSRAVQPLIGLLIDSDSHQRGLILEALSQIGTRTLKPMNRALTIALQDENAQVRKNAIRDLTQMYELMAKLSKLLYLAADDPDPEVQETARWALRQLNSLQLPNISEESNVESS